MRSAEQGYKQRLCQQANKQEVVIPQWVVSTTAQREATLMSINAKRKHHLAAQVLGLALVLLGLVTGDGAESLLGLACYLVLRESARVKTIARRLDVPKKYNYASVSVECLTRQRGP